MKKALSSHAAAAAAIRSELKAAFPTIKFSVTSESFSMGDAVRIHWTDGPSTQVIDAIVGKYQYGHFDGMTDYYDSDNRREDIPQAKYIDTTRKLSVGFIRKVAEKLATLWGREIVINETKYGGWQVGDGLGPDVRDIEDLIYRELRDLGEEALEVFNLKKRGGVRYDDLNDSNMVDEGTVPDGYNGHTARVSLHVVGGERWIKTKHGCFRAPEGGLAGSGWTPAPARRELDLGAGDAVECREFFSASEERGLSALADYYDEEARRVN